MEICKIRDVRQSLYALGIKPRSYPALLTLADEKAGRALEGQEKAFGEILRPLQTNGYGTRDTDLLADLPLRRRTGTGGHHD
jgi:hypothetical protein